MKLMNLRLNPGTNKNLGRVVRGLVLTGLIAGGVACNQCKKQEEASFNKANNTIEINNEIVKQQGEMNKNLYKLYENGSKIDSMYKSYKVNNEIVKQQGEMNKILHKLYKQENETGSIIDSMYKSYKENIMNKL